MLSIYKKIVLLVMSTFLSMGMVTGLAFGTLITLTLDAKEDAGQSPGHSAYVRFVAENDVNNVLHTVLPTTVLPFTAASYYNYASDQGISNWLLESVGNIWSSDQVIGEFLTGLHAGYYRMSPLGGAYQYDSFGWSADPNDQKWRWEMHIQAINGLDVNDYILGSTNPFDTADDAFNAASGSYHDINIAEGGSLRFWIWDVNSIDNSGWLSINVTALPEPATILLLGLGLAALRGIRILRK